MLAWFCGRFVSLDQPQRLIHLVHHLDGADQDAAVRVAALGTEARLVGGPLAFVFAAHDDDRARRVMHAVLADRAEQRLGQPAVAAGGHHEQVSAFGRVH